MNAAGDGAALLRPLTLGEIFDRAVTLYVRNFVPFSLIVLVVIVPTAVLHYFAGLHASSTFTQLLQQIENPKRTVTPMAATTDGLFALASLGVSILLGAFAAVAVAVATARLYDAGRIDWGACYIRTLSRVGSILLVLAIEIVLMIMVIFAGAIAMGLAFFVAGVAVSGSVVLGVLAFIAAAIVVLVWLVFLVLCYFAFAFAYNAIGVEGTNLFVAMGSGFSRIFNRSEVLRACLVALAFVAMYIGLFIVQVSVAAVFEAMNLHILNVAITAVISLVTFSFLTILLAVYYFDVRVRREGLDMQAQMERLESAAGAP